MKQRVAFPVCNKLLESIADRIEERERKQEVEIIMVNENDKKT